MNFRKILSFKIFRKNKMIRVSLTEQYLFTNRKLALLQLLSNIFLIAFSLVMIASSTINGLILIPLAFVILVFGNKLMKRYRLKVYETLFIRQKLLRLLKQNNFYTMDSDDTGKQYVSTSAILYFLIEENSIIVRANITGDSFTRRLRELDDYLVGALGLDLTEKKDAPSYTNYIFVKRRPTRLIINSLDKNEMDSNFSINLGCDVLYSPIKCPHILVAGGTGSGKSMFISYLLLIFLKQKSSVFLCDPKNSDLGNLSHYFGDERVAHTPNNIARIVRLVVEEMNARYNLMRENFKYGSNFVDHGYNPVWLIFDEIGAFQASGTDKASKAVINEVMDGLKQIILLGRQSGVFILVAGQQMRAETLSTDLRDNLGLRIALGANSSEGYRMVLGNAAQDLKPVEMMGAGYLYQQSSGKEKAQYYETPLFPENFNFIEELKKYI